MLHALNAFFKKPSKAVEVRIIDRDPLRILTKEWRADAKLCAAAARALSDPVTRQMLDVLRANNLSNMVMVDQSPNARSIHLARCEGFSMALNDLESLAVYAKPTAELEATFEAELAEEIQDKE